MILIFRSDHLNSGFYGTMGAYFASLEIAKELERQVYNKPDTDWFVSMDYVKHGHFEDYERVQGFASVHHERNGLFIDNLYVRPEYRHRGIATQIIRDIDLEYRGEELPRKCIAVNPYAMAIFKKFGFEEVGKVGKYTKLEKH